MKGAIVSLGERASVIDDDYPCEDSTLIMAPENASPIDEELASIGELSLDPCKDPSSVVVLELDEVVVNTPKVPEFSRTIAVGCALSRSIRVVRKSSVPFLRGSPARLCSRC